MMPTTESVFNRVSSEHAPDLCKILRIQPGTLTLFLAGKYRAPEIDVEIQRRLRTAGLLTETRHDA